MGLACKRTCTGFADKHCKPTREGSAVHSYATKFPLSGKRNFPYTEIFPLRCRAYRKRLSLPFGIDDSLAADYLCQQKKAMKNGKHTIIRLIRLIRGQKNKRLTEREARLTLKIGVSSVSGVSGVSGVSFRFWTKKTPVFGPNRNKTGVSSVPSVPSVPQSSLPSFQGGAGGRLSPNQARSATNQASLRAANQARSATNLF